MRTALHKACGIAALLFVCGIQVLGSEIGKPSLLFLQAWTIIKCIAMTGVAACVAWRLCKFTTDADGIRARFRENAVFIILAIGAIIYSTMCCALEILQEDLPLEWFNNTIVKDASACLWITRIILILCLVTYRSMRQGNSAVELEELPWHSPWRTMLAIVCVYHGLSTAFRPLLSPNQFSVVLVQLGLSSDSLALSTIVPFTTMFWMRAAHTFFSGCANLQRTTTADWLVHKRSEPFRFKRVWFLSHLQLVSELTCSMRVLSA